MENMLGLVSVGKYFGCNLSGILSIEHILVRPFSNLQKAHGELLLSSNVLTQ